jgi:hypothetical protein
VTRADRFLWAQLSQLWSGWRSAIVIVKPETMIWHRKAFWLFWTWKVRHGQSGRPLVFQEIRQLIRKVSRESRFGERPAFSVSCSIWASTSAKLSVAKYIA